jgi:DivIVA domain-containing protein
MASTDVTPQELRDIEIREAWRGYHRDDVDELLERAAATIEHLEEENQQLKTRLAQAPSGGRQPAPVAKEAAPVAPPPVAPPPVRPADTDVIQRTLVLAQKAADEAVAEARAKAQQMLAESESKAEQLVTDAEEAARRITDTERSKLEVEIARLSETRDTLSADVDALERFDVEYRERLRVAIEAELDLLKSTSQGVTDRPSLHRVDAPRAASTWSASQEAVVSPPPPAAISASSAQIEGVPAYAEHEDESWEAPTAAVVDDLPDDGGVEPEPAPRSDRDDTGPHDSLDDDAFFASLREAVRDDSPLGTDDDSTDFFEQGGDDAEDERRLFRRRR